LARPLAHARGSEWSKSLRGTQAAKANPMKTRRSAGFTILEVLLVVFLVVILLGLLLPVIMRDPCRSQRIHCTSNLKQIGLALRMWANDHGERFPMALSAAEGGTKESALQDLPLPSFLIISNELNNPQSLTCTHDKERERATEFAKLTPKNLSYFLGVDASETSPQTILAGDRNMCVDSQPTNGLVLITDWSTVTWDKTIHNRQGNIGLADGSAHQVTDLLFQKALQATGLVTNRFAIP
jgi:type II secretory pathway pseudopilin PulG